MKKSRFSEEQMVKILREADRTPISEVASIAFAICSTVIDLHFASLTNGKSCSRGFALNGPGARRPLVSLFRRAGWRAQRPGR